MSLLLRFLCCTLHSAMPLPKFSTSIGVTLMSELPPFPPASMTHHGSPLAIKDPASGLLLFRGFIPGTTAYHHTEQQKRDERQAQGKGKGRV